MKFICRHQNVGQVHDVMTANTSLKSVTKFRYLTFPKHEDMKSRLNSVNACYYSVHNPLS